MRLSSESFADLQPIPPEYALCAMDPATHARWSDNLNPHLAWSEAPAGTQSLVLICVDPDVPSRGEDVNQEGRSVPASLPRVDFFHWVLVDIPASLTSIARGAHASSVTAKGKPGPTAPHGMRHGVNDYTGWFAGDAAMGGDYYGYDGPCPPWNDEIAHRYVFAVYALDLPRCPVDGRFTGADVRKAIAGHVLAEASLTGRYTLNPNVSP